MCGDRFTPTLCLLLRLSDRSVSHCNRINTSPRQAKIANDRHTFVIDEDVGRFQVTVHDVGRMHEVYGAKEVVHDGNDVLLTQLQLVSVFQNCVQI